MRKLLPLSLALAGSTMADGFLTFTKSFGAPTVPVGGTVALQFNIVSTANFSINAITFSDSLGAGLTATGNVNGSCAGGVISAAGSTVNLTGANFGPFGSCSFSVDVLATG